MEGEEASALVRLDPVIAGDEGLVLVGSAVTIDPGGELAASNAEPSHDAATDDLGLLGQVANEVDDLVAGVVGNPAAGQGSPSSFF